MADIEKYSSKLPSTLKIGLINHLLLQQASSGVTYNAVELVISLKQHETNIKDLSSYLDFIYRVDGRISEIGYKRYVHRPRIQIEIDEVRVGSWEIVFQRFIDSIDAEKLAIVFLVLKFLPEVAKTLANGIRSYYEIRNAREDYLEKREKRRVRKEIRELINIEENFSTLEKKQKEKLVVLLEDLYKTSEKNLPSAARLAQKSVKDVRLVPIVKKKKGQ